MADDISTSLRTRQLIDTLNRLSGMGSLHSSYADILSGFNHRGYGTIFPIHAANSGIVFFTRPNLNLSGNNLAVDRVMSHLLTSNTLTLQRAIRAMLYPAGNVFNLNAGQGQLITTPLFDHKQAFIPLLTNALKSLDGWPDIALDTYTSKEGVLRENFSFVDGTHHTYNTGDLSATFRNYGGDPITLLLLVWCTYASHVRRGTMVPLLKSRITNRIDYHTRIFRFTLTPDRRYIEKWASTTGCFPVGVPVGASMNYSDDTPLVHNNSESVSMAFRHHGAEYFDPIIFEEFNETVYMFNPDMADARRTSVYTKIPYEYLKLFNFSGYPRINNLTNELEWWVETTALNERIQEAQAVLTAQPVVVSVSTASPPRIDQSAAPPPALTDSVNIANQSSYPSGSNNVTAALPPGQTTTDDGSE